MPDLIDMNTASIRRIRRTPDQMIADLQAQIATVKAREQETIEMPPAARSAQPKPRVAKARVATPMRFVVPTTARTPDSLDADIEARVHAFTADLVALIKRATLDAVADAVDDLGVKSVASSPRELVPQPPPFELTPARPPTAPAKRKNASTPVSATSEPVSFARYERMAIERAIAECGGDLLAAAALLKSSKSAIYRRMKALGIVSPAQGGSIAIAPDDPVIAVGGPVSFEAYEKVALVRALEECGGNRQAAAMLLRVGKSTLYRMATKHGVG